MKRTVTVTEELLTSDCYDVTVGNINGLTARLRQEGPLLNLDLFKLDRRANNAHRGIRVVIHARGTLRFEKFHGSRTWYLVRGKAENVDPLIPLQTWWSESKPYANTAFEYVTVPLGLDLALGENYEQEKI